MSTITEVKERPILFSSDMVRAILDGRKTQTRRVIKGLVEYDIDYLEGCETYQYPIDENELGVNCPYGKPGDLLYVRETFAKMCKEGDPYCWCETEEQKKENHFIQYKADTWHEFRCEGRYDKYPGNWDDAPYPPGMDHHPAEADYIPRWKPSIHMPKDIARIWLEVEDIRVERVQDISETDAVAEGIPNGAYTVNPKTSFKKLWDSINADRGYSWEVNPWVWVVYFNVK